MKTKQLTTILFLLTLTIQFSLAQEACKVLKPEIAGKYTCDCKKGLDQRFDNIRFPFTCKVNYSTPNSLRTATYEVVFEIEINEPGQWLVTLSN